MRFAIAFLLLLLAACGGAGGGSTATPQTPPPVTPAPLELAVAGRAVVKLRAFAGGTTVMEEKLKPILQAGGPDRVLELFDAHGVATGRYTPPSGFALVDFAQHPGGEVTAVLAGAKTVTLVRLTRAASVLDQSLVVDPQAATDRYYDEGGVRDDESLVPVFTRDASAVAPLGESVVLALRSGRNATIAYRYDRPAGGGFSRAWRTLVEPGLSVFGIGITSGTFDTFGALENAQHVAMDIDESSRIAVAVPSSILSAHLFAAHADFFSEPNDASQGVLVTRLGADGARLGSTVIDTSRRSELHGLRAGGNDVAVVGRVFTQRRDDGSGWDAYVAHVGAASGALSGYRAVDVDRGDILFDIAALGGGRWLAVGATGYTQNPDGASVSETAAPLAIVLDADSTVRSRITVAGGPRNNIVRSIASTGNRWMVAGQLNGPGTHSGDGDPAAIAADGFVREVAIPAS